MINRLTGKTTTQLARTKTFGSTIIGSSASQSKNYSSLYNMHSKNVDIRRAIQEKQNAIGQNRYLQKNGETLVAGTPEYDEIYNVLNNKNIDGLQRDYEIIKNKIIKDINITGNTYVYLNRNDQDKVIGIQILDPRYVSIVADEYGRILGYVYRPAGSMQYYRQSDVVHIRDGIDDENDLYGTSNLEALRHDVLADEYAAITNKVRFENMNVPSYLVILEDNLSGYEAEAIINSMTDFFGGAENAHKAAATKGVKEIIPIQQNTSDMDYAALRKFTTEKVCAAFGVPKIMLGYNEGVNHANADVLYRQYIETTIQPEEKRLEYYMHQIVQAVNPDISFFYKSVHLDKLSQNIDVYTKALDNGILTIDEIRNEIGRTPYETEVSMQPVIKNSLLQLDDMQLKGYDFTIDENAGAGS